MFGGWYEVTSMFLSLCLMGFAIKMMDDYLDGEYDLCQGRHTLSIRLGRASLPYALIAAILGTYFNPSIAVAVFCGSYAVGMFTTWQEKLPTRLPAYAEIAIAASVSWILTGWQIAFWGLSMMAVVDWLDDIVDYSRDKINGSRNIALRIGIIETLLLLLFALFIAVFLNAKLTVFCFLTLTILTVISEITTIHLWKTNEEDEEARKSWRS